MGKALNSQGLVDQMTGLAAISQSLSSGTPGLAWQAYVWWARVVEVKAAYGPCSMDSTDQRWSTADKASPWIANLPATEMYTEHLL